MNFGPGWRLRMETLIENCHETSIGIYLITGNQQETLNLDIEFTFNSLNPRTNKPLKRFQCSAFHIHGLACGAGRGWVNFLTKSFLLGRPELMADDACAIGVKIISEAGIRLTEEPEGGLRSCGRTMLLKAMTAPHQFDTKFLLYKHRPTGSVTSNDVGVVYVNGNLLHCIATHIASSEYHCSHAVFSSVKLAQSHLTTDPMSCLWRQLRRVHRISLRKTQLASCSGSTSAAIISRTATSMISI